jgi:hypothetical protein
MAADVIQVLMLDVFQPRFEAWLDSQGFALGRLPSEELPEDALPTFVVTPKHL